MLSIIDKHERVVVGLMSGTSMDGIDAALLKIKGSGVNTSWKLINFKSYPYTQHIRESIHRTFKGDTRNLCVMNFQLGELFARAALDIMEVSGYGRGEVDLIGSHGQTVFHIHGNSTLQIGEPSIIADRCGAVVVSDFRVMDVAAGGCGAPLVPYVDFILFRHEKYGRLVLNIGGIANFTVLPRGVDGIEQLYAFDTGPGVMVIDAVTSWITDGKMKFDRDGELASKGRVNPHIMERLMAVPFITKRPPKSTGREEFGREFLERLLSDLPSLNHRDRLDLLATVTDFTAKAVYENYRLFVKPGVEIDELIVGGGGTHNVTLMDSLKGYFQPIPVITSQEFGVPVDAKEAVAFAILANETISGNTSNVPNVTGAKYPVILGKIVPV